MVLGLAMLVVAMEVRAQGTTEGRGLSDAHPTQSRVPKYDRATLHGVAELDGYEAGFEDLGQAACRHLVRKNVANWNVSGGECKFVKFLNNPTHGVFLAGSKPGEFRFHPKSLGKDVVRFVVENTVDGRRAIVTWYITVVEPEAALQVDELSLPA